MPATLRLFTDSLHLQEIKQAELFPAGQSVYSLNHLASTEVQRVFVFSTTWTEVPFSRFDGAIKLSQVAAGEVLVIPSKRLDLIQLGASAPVQLFIKQNINYAYSQFTITSYSNPGRASSGWLFSATKDGAGQAELSLAAVPDSVWLTYTSLSTNLTYDTVLELSALASLKEK